MARVRVRVRAVQQVYVGDPNPNPNPTQCTDVAEAAGRRPWLVDLGDLNGKGWVPFFAAVPALLAFILVFLDDGSPWLLTLSLSLSLGLTPTLTLARHHVAPDQPARQQAHARRRLPLGHPRHRLANPIPNHWDTLVIGGFLVVNP